MQGFIVYDDFITLALQGSEVIEKGRMRKVADSTQMLKGILDGCILSIIEEGEIYGYELAEKLQSYGFQSFSEGSIYPLLLRMQKEGLVSNVQRKSTAGPKRKYYSLTEAGQAELEQFLGRWADLKQSVDAVITKGGQ